MSGELLLWSYSCPRRKQKGITWSVMARGHSLVLSPSRGVLVNGLLHGLEIEADESSDGTELI